MARLLGIDPGTKRIGVALSDPEGRIASPHGTIDSGEPDADAREIARLASENEVEEVVVGYPRRLDGTTGPAAEHAADLARRIETVSGVTVTLWDERMTSVQAERTMIAHGVKRRRRRATTDRVAATLILQSYLDARNRS